MSITKEMWGKKLKDMSPEEKKAYLSYMRKKNYTPSDGKGFSQWCVITFGKRCRDLTPDEKREFYRLRKQLEREKKRKEKDES